MIIGDYEEDIKGEDVILHVFERNEKSERIHKEITDFKPYFYVEESCPDIDDFDSVVDVEYGHKGLEGEDLKKVICKKPSDIGRLRNVIENKDKFDTKTWESDVHFPTRYAIDEAEKDENGDIKKQPIRKCFLDIEVTQEGDKFPEPEKAKQEVISITVYDNVLDKYIVFIWRGDKKEDKIEKDWGTVYQFSDEEDMLELFISFINDTNPDILAGWNVDEFDMQYLVNRMKNLDINFYQLSPIGNVEIDDRYGKTEVRIGGRAVFDQLEAYKFMTFGKRPSYSLDSIASIELGEEKIHFDETITELWKNDYDKLIEYNKKDVRLCVDIDEEMDMIDFVDQVRRFTYCDFDIVFTSMLQVYSYILRKANKWDIRIPRQTDPEPSETSGGFVINPKKNGLVENVAVADLKSLYPSLIISGNMSPETLVEGETDRETIELSEDADTYRKEWVSDDFNSVDTKFLSHNEKLGFLPKVLDTMFDTRAQFKDKMREAAKNGNEAERMRNYRKQRAVKIIMNTMYGVLGNKGFNLYRPEIADSITWFGRTTIKWSEYYIENEFGNDVIYGDTDSVFFQSGDLDEAKEIIEALNNSYDEFAEGFNIPADEHRLFIEFEKRYERIFFGQDKKKRYAGLKDWDEDKGKLDTSNVTADDLDITGFEAKRANNAPLTQEIQREVFYKLLTGEGEDSVIQYLKNKKEQLEKGNIDLDKVGIPQGIGKELSDYKSKTPHVRGAIYANRNLGKNFGQGSDPKLIYVKRMPQGYPQPPGNGAVCFEDPQDLPDGVEIDWTTMLDKVVKQAVNNIFNDLGINWNRVHGQQGLMDF